MSEKSAGGFPFQYKRRGDQAVIGSIRGSDLTGPDQPVLRTENMIDARPGGLIGPKPISLAGDRIAIAETGRVIAAFQIPPMLPEQFAGGRDVEVAANDEGAMLRAEVVEHP